MRRIALVVVVWCGIAVSGAQDRLSLNDAITIAMEQNPDLRAASRELAASEGRVLQAGRIANPEISVQFNLAPTTLDLGKAQEKDIAFVQTLEFPGKRGARIDVAEHDQWIARRTVERLTASTTTRVTQAYYRVLLANAVEGNLSFTIALLEDFLKVVTERYQAGTSSYLDVLRTKVELTRLRNEQVQAWSERYAREAELNVRIGRSADAGLTLTDSLVYHPFELSRDSTVAMYETRSAYLKIVDREIMRAQSQIDLAGKSYLPDYTLGVSLQNRPGSLSPTGSSRYLGFEFGLSLPLWFWQSPRGELLEAQARLDIITLRREAARRVVRQRILSAYRTVQAAQIQLESFRASLLQDAEDELRSGIVAYQNNQIDVLNLFDIYRTTLATRIEYTRSLFNYLNARADLESTAEVME
ncbi:MAG: TolC family protein [Bacteroidota bacterium]